MPIERCGKAEPFRASTVLRYGTTRLERHMTGTERRKHDPVEFERGIDVRLMAIDGTWHRGCTMREVADGGARLVVQDSIEGLKLDEFFLLLSSTGCAYRRCELAWVNGHEIGANFVRRPVKGAKPTAPTHP